MYEIIYLSTEDRKAREELNTKLMRASSDEERSLLHAQIQEIDARCKHLKDCTHEECIALKAQMFDKFQKLQKIGRAGQARQFNVMLQMVDFRIRMLNLEAKRNQNPNQIILKVEQEKPATREQAPRSSERNVSGRSVWQIAKKIDELD